MRLGGGVGLGLVVGGEGRGCGLERWIWGLGGDEVGCGGDGLDDGWVGGEGDGGGYVDGCLGVKDAGRG